MRAERDVKIEKKNKRTKKVNHKKIKRIDDNNFS